MEQTEQKVRARRRGAPSGNRNAVGNRGNVRAGGSLGNRGGRGAPVGNTYACKERRPHEDLLRRYGQDVDLAAWIKAHAALLDEAAFTADEAHDRAYYQMAAAGVSFDDVLAEREG